MKTATNWPIPRSPCDREPDMGEIFFSVFDDVTPRWSLEDMNYTDGADDEASS